MCYSLYFDTIKPRSAESCIKVVIGSSHDHMRDVKCQHWDSSTPVLAKEVLQTFVLTIAQNLRSECYEDLD